MGRPSCRARQSAGAPAGRSSEGRGSGSILWLCDHRPPHLMLEDRAFRKTLSPHHRQRCAEEIFAAEIS
ncbi:hypothetical protein RHECNPAF_730059 [Rhizobium etli CNPAF512]|nr:hypothetical protein RHECNPAF_730059 [Rhizobium etli CNPAF512]